MSSYHLTPSELSVTVFHTRLSGCESCLCQQLHPNLKYFVKDATFQIKQSFQLKKKFKSQVKKNLWGDILEKYLLIMNRILLRKTRLCFYVYRSRRIHFHANLGTFLEVIVIVIIDIFMYVILDYLHNVINDIACLLLFSHNPDFDNQQITIRFS